MHTRTASLLHTLQWKSFQQLNSKYLQRRMVCPAFSFSITTTIVGCFQVVEHINKLQQCAPLQTMGISLMYAATAQPLRVFFYQASNSNSFV